MIDTIQFLNGRATESAGADNALATATMGAVSAARHFLTGIKAGYSAAPAAGFKIIQIKFGTVVQFNIEWDPTKEMPLWFGFPGQVHGDYNQAVSAELAASGTATVLGRVALFGYTM